MTSQDALTIAVSLTDEILTVLDDQNLERLAELEAKREPIIRQAFEQSVKQIDQIKAVHLQNLNQQVVEKLLELKQSTKQKMQHISRAEKATRAYQGNQL
jgi:hypothetical protein